MPIWNVFSGTVWHSVQRAVPVPGSWPLKWHRMQVEVVTAMWLPCTICEWHEVQRSFLPRRMSDRCAVWSNCTPWMETLPTELAPLVAAQARGVVDLGPRVRL